MELPHFRVFECLLCDEDQRGFLQSCARQMSEDSLLLLLVMHMKEPEVGSRRENGDAVGHVDTTEPNGSQVLLLERGYDPVTGIIEESWKFSDGSIENPAEIVEFRWRWSPPASIAERCRSLGFRVKLGKAPFGEDLPHERWLLELRLDP